MLYTGKNIHSLPVSHGQIDGQIDGQSDGQRHQRPTDRRRLIHGKPGHLKVSALASASAIARQKKDVLDLSSYANANADADADHVNNFFFTHHQNRRRRRPSQPFNYHLISVGWSVADEKTNENKKKKLK